MAFNWTATKNNYHLRNEILAKTKMTSNLLLQKSSISVRT